MSVGKFIKEKREEKGITQQELADAIGYERSMIAHIERESKPVTLRQAAAIAEELGVTLEEMASA